jgi:hypothetical protein
MLDERPLIAPPPLAKGATFEDDLHERLVREGSTGDLLPQTMAK